ncbi:MAG: metallophosphoesterase [Candidatus Hydrogenedentales bacterium]|jgi:3',5'-cyclic AMP phosphodiesterase CpdA
MMRIFRNALLTVLAVILTALGGSWVYRQATWVAMDLSPLVEFAKSQDYAALVKRIAAQPVQPEGFTFVVLGDTRSNINIAREVMAQVTYEKPAFILSNGDLVRRGRVEEYVAHHIPLVEQVAPIPFLPIPGNHESGPNRDFAPFRAIYGDVRLSFDYGDCRFVGVNNGDWDGMSRADLNYLDAELSNPGVSHRFVLFHIPPRFMENAVESEDGRGFTWNAKRLREILIRHKVNQVFVGHVHGYASEVIDGVRYTISGGAGADLTTSLGKTGNVHNYIVVQVGPDGVKSYVVRKLDGSWTRSLMD